MGWIWIDEEEDLPEEERGDYNCWSCRHMVWLEDVSHNDGLCTYCGVEIGGEDE